MWARSQPWKIPRVGLCVRHTTDQECRYVFLCRYCFRRRPSMRSCAKGAPGGPEKKGASPPRRRRPPDSDVEGATLLRLACERGGVDCRLLRRDRKSTRLNSSHLVISYAVFCLKKKRNI